MTRNAADGARPSLSVPGARERDAVMDAAFMKTPVEPR